MIIHWNTRTNPHVVLAEGIYSFPTHVTDPTDTVEAEVVPNKGMLAARHVRRSMRKYSARGRR